MLFDQNWLLAPGLTWKKAYALSQACKLAYDKPNRIRKVVTDAWKMEAHPFSRNQTQGFVALGSRVAIVSLRGTKGLGDWGVNLQSLPTDFPPLQGKVHAGFKTAWDDVADIVDDHLAQVGPRTLWFTGHSLGGALAVLGASSRAARPAGVVTFGQPRLLNLNAARFIAQKFGQAYSRIVNDDDIVARIPTNFNHSGALFHFEFDGRLKGAQSEFEAEVAPEEFADDGPPPLSELEYDALKAAIDRINSKVEAPEALLDLEADGLGEMQWHDPDVAIEGFLPGVPSHRIDSYVQLMFRQAFPPATPDVSEALSSINVRRSGDMMTSVRGSDFFAVEETVESPFESEESFGTAAAPAPVRQPVLLRLRSSDWQPPAGLMVGSRLGRFATAYATSQDLRRLEDDPGVASVEVSREAGINDLDTSIPFVHGDVVHRPPVPERGDHALVGIVDTGVDILHRAFLDAGGNTRIRALWDQRGHGGPTPHAVDPNVFEQNFGRLYLADEIDAFIAAHAAGAPNHPSRLRDRNQHGTHVAGIAAGRATGDLPDGMAPEAGLVVVMSAISSEPGDPPSIGYSNAHVDALTFMRRVSEGGNAVSAQSLPIAINVSQGMNAGAHDGTTTLEAAFDAVTGGGRDPGIVIVKSAGNERGHAGHAKKAVFEQGIERINWQSSNRLRSEDYFEAWFDGLDDIAFTLIDPGGNRSDVVSFDDKSVDAALGGNLCQLRLTEMHRDNAHHRLTISIRNQPQQIQSGTWGLELHGRQVLSTHGEVHIWVERNRVRPVRFDVEDEAMTLSIPGTADSVVCVAASGSELPIRLNDSSSFGLTWDRRAKPDLCAPGRDIRSAHAAQHDLDAATTMSGTSMAAPHVAGALALALSHLDKAGRPQMNASQLRRLLIRTVEGTPRHHIGAGFGVLNVEQMFDLLN